MPDFLNLRKLPFLSRRNFLYEYLHLLPWSVLAGLIDGQFASVVVSRAFHGSSRLIAIASATPFAAYIFSLTWGMLSVGRPKLKLCGIFGAGTALCAGLIGAIPNTAAGAKWFVVQMAAAQILLAGVVTVRSAIWKSNYPREFRGQIVSRLQAIRSLVSVVAVQIAAALSDRYPDAYRFIFPAAAVCGLAGLALLSQARIRGEKSELRAIANRSRRAPASTLTAAFSPFHVASESVVLLRADRRFASYCVAQFIQGFANLMTISVAVALVTRHLETPDRHGFWISSALLIGLPILCLLVSIRRWGRLFDGVGVLRFRVINVLCQAMALMFGLAGTLAIVRGSSLGSMYYPLAVALFALRGIFHGLAQGGGTIAWNLGHLHFASPHQSEMYMGIHVFLAGVRGFIAPLGGMWLWTIIGWWVWPISVGLTLLSIGLYATLARRDVENDFEMSAAL